MRKRLGFHLACLVIGVAIFASRWDFQARWRYQYFGVEQPESYLAIDLATLLQELKSRKMVLVDLRETTAFDLGHLKGALSCPYGTDVLEVLEAIDDLDEWWTVILYDTSIGNNARANKVASELRQVGLQNVLFYKGGWAEWTSCELPVWTP